MPARKGSAGSGKTSTLSAIRHGAEQSGYVVEGFAPTSRAAYQLRDVGIAADTLQGFLARSRNTDAAGKHLYVVDESSLTSTQQMAIDADFDGALDALFGLFLPLRLRATAVRIRSFNADSLI
jgi:hypothetical protein